MKYFKVYKEAGAKAVEITKEDASRTLGRWWKQTFLDDMFERDLMFRLYTPFAEVWTQTDDGMIPEAGFYGVCD